MKLEQASVRSFGLLRNYTVNFENGLNIVEGGNETGKTTLAAFIRFMLYIVLFFSYFAFSNTLLNIFQTFLINISSKFNHSFHQIFFKS